MPDFQPKPLEPAGVGGWKIGLILLALHATVYAPSLLGGFVYDDHRQVVESSWIRSLENIPEMFRHSMGYFQNPNDPLGPGNYYRPLHMVSYALIYSVFGASPFGFHLANWLLSLGVSLMVYWLARTWFPASLAGLAAMVFTLQPTHVESVAWVASLPELLSAILFLLVFKLHTREEWPAWLYGVAGGCVLAAALTRENTLVLPLLMVGYDWLTPGRGWGWLKRQKNWQRYAVCLLSILLYFYFRSQVLGYPISNPRLKYPLTRLEILLSLPMLLAQYFWHFLVPPRMSAFHVLHPVTTLADYRLWLSLGVLGVLAGWAYRLYCFERKVFFWLIWIPVAVLPFLYLPGLGLNALTERYMFLPSIGATLLWTYGLHYLYGQIKTPEKQRRYRLAVLALLLFWSGVTFHRIFYWRNDIALCLKTLQTDPDAYPFMNILGYAYYADGQESKAVATFESLAAHFPREADGLGNAPVTYARVRALGRPYNAYKQSFFEAQTKLAAVFFRQGNYARAGRMYQDLIEIFPNDGSMFYFLAECLEKTGNPVEAILDCREALLRTPGNSAAQNQLARLMQGYKPKPILSLCRRAKLYTEQKRYGDAVILLQRAMRDDPLNPMPHHYLFNVYWLQGEKEKARQAIWEALRRDPENKLFQFNFQALTAPPAYSDAQSPGGPDPWGRETPVHP